MRLGLGLGLACSLGGGVGGGGSPALSPYEGQVATRSAMPHTTLAETAIMSRVAMFASEALTSYKVKFAGWFCDGSDVSFSVGSAVTYVASIEYPANTFTQITWSGGSGVAPVGGDTGLSDAITVAIPSAAQFWVRVYATTTAAGIPASLENFNAGLGDACVHNGTATNQTLSGTVTSTGDFGIYPMCLIQTTTRASFLFLGDSRTGSYGAGTTGDTGLFAPSINTNYGYINAGRSSSRLRDFITSGALRRALSEYVSHVINGYGINDMIVTLGNRSAAEVQADFLTSAHSMPGKAHILATILPYTTSTDSWATLGNQTVFGREADRVAFNTWAKALPDPYVACIDVASVVESGTTGKWVVGYTTDGLHQSASGGAQIVSSGVLTPATVAALVANRRWTPLQYSTVDWWDAANAATSGATPVLTTSTTSDTSSLTGSATYGATTFNGGPGYDLTGGGDYHLRSNSPVSQNTGGVLFGLLWIPTTNPASNAAIGGYTTNSTSDQRAMIMQDTTGKLGVGIRRLDADSLVTAYSASAFALNQPYLLVGQYDPATGTAKLYVDGVLVATATYGTTGNTSNTAAGFGIMGFLGSKLAFGKWREFMAFNATVSDAEREKMEGFIAWRAGMNTSNLPVAHPYRSTRPTL